MTALLPATTPAEILGDQLLPILTAAGFTFDTVQSPDGRWRIHTNDVVLPGRGVVAQLLVTDLVDRNGYQERPIVFRAVVGSVEQAVAFLRVAGVLPAVAVDVDRIAQAIGDPGSIAGNRVHTSFGDDRDETITRWATRAVLKVLAEHAGGAR